MIAVDTNIVVRVITADGDRQYALALKLFETASIWLAVTVVLETEWVLRHAYKRRRDEIAEVLRDMLGLPNVTVEHADQVAQALDWHEAGMDFADAMHLAAAHHCETFATFDRALIAAAGRPNVNRPVREP